MSIRPWRALAAAVLAASAFAVVTPPAQAVTDPVTGWEIVATGLRNPRGLLILPDGRVAVAEAGANGVFPCNPPSPGTSGKPACYSETGAITVIGNGTQTRVVDGLPSLGPPDGGSASGPHDLTLVNGGVMVTSGYANNPTLRGDLGGQSHLLGSTYVLRSDLSRHKVGDLAAYEATYNPDGLAGFDGLWTNPYATVRHGDDFLVVDAGANTLYRVTKHGKVSVEYVFPNRTVQGPAGPMEMQPVPDAIVQGPDGAYYIGELTGAPYPVGGARVYRYVPGTGAPTVWATGFTNIIDMYFDGQGRLHVLEMARNGALSGDPTGRIVRINADGSRTDIATTGLIFPTSLAIAADGSIYVSNKAIFPVVGEVVRIPPS